MNIGAAVGYPFKNKSWFVNALMMFVCMIIPVIGPLVLLGYQVVLTKMLVRDINSAPAKFDFGNFSKYLTRGVAPFVVSLLASLVLMPLIFLSWAPFFISMIATGGGDKGGAVIIIGMLVSIILEVGAIILFTICMVPLQLRSELEGQIGSSFKLDYIKIFMKKMWKQIIVFAFVMFLLAMLAMIVGMIACFVGIYLTMTLLMLSQSHLRAQLYLASLERGVPALNIQPDELVDVATKGFEPIMKS